MKRVVGTATGYMAANRRRVETGGRRLGDLNDHNNTGEDIPLIQNSVVFYPSHRQHLHHGVLQQY